jgi:hypothetical protein
LAAWRCELRGSGRSGPNCIESSSSLRDRNSLRGSSRGRHRSRSLCHQSSGGIMGIRSPSRRYAGAASASRRASTSGRRHCSELAQRYSCRRRSSSDDHGTSRGRGRPASVRGFARRSQLGRWRGRSSNGRSSSSRHAPFRPSSPEVVQQPRTIYARCTAGRPRLRDAAPSPSPQGCSEPSGDCRLAASWGAALSPCSWDSWDAAVWAPAHGCRSRGLASASGRAPAGYYGRLARPTLATWDQYDAPDVDSVDGSSRAASPPDCGQPRCHPLRVQALIRASAWTYGWSGRRAGCSRQQWVNPSCRRSHKLCADDGSDAARELLQSAPAEFARRCATRRHVPNLGQRPSWPTT